MGHIMNYKVYLYIIFTAISVFSLSGINFNNFFKKDKAIESKIFVMIIAFALGYLLTNYFYDFINAMGKI